MTAACPPNKKVTAPTSTPPGAPTQPPIGGPSRLVVPGEPHTYTTNRECDARTALTRGLAEYLASMTASGPGGRPLAFRRVVSTWAQPEELAEYPSAAVLAGAGTYGSSRFTPGRGPRIATPDQRYVLNSAEFTVDMTVELWCTDPKERAAMVALLEDRLLAPLDSRYGFILELPHYFNARAQYEPTGLSYDDSEENAMRRYRKAVLTVKGQVPVIRLISLPDADMVARITVDDSTDC
jgi:hypothetical protein